MKNLNTFVLVVAFLIFTGSYAQTIGDFTSVEPVNQSTDLVIPSSHSFQYIIQNGDALTAGGTMPDFHDYSGYVPIGGSSTNGYLSINSEKFPGGVTVLDVNLDATNREWLVTASEKVDFSPVGGTAYNCSGAITSWGTVISCEEVTAFDGNGDGYYDYGWSVEVDPVTKVVIDKRWAMGNFAHENVAIHPNNQTFYQGADSDPGYIFKFVADQPEDLSSGKLYVYQGSKNGSGNWILLNNTTKYERNTTLQQCTSVGATVFKGVEDIEVGPDGKLYVAVKDECVVYRFTDSDPLTGTTVSDFETYAGGMNYDIDYGTGTVSEPWGCGNDNLAFDGEGNLWVLQDGDKNYIWLVKNGHTQASPLVELFGVSPFGSEPTGITFTPDYKYMYISIMHPSSSNNSTYQQDAFGTNVGFDKDITIAIARIENFGPCNVTVTVSATSDYNGYNVSCNGGGDGSAEVFPADGTAPYTYQWDDPLSQTTKVATGLSAGVYSVTVTDAGGCVTSGNVTLTEPDPLSVDAGENQIVYYGYPAAECATLTATDESGGVPPYSYLWSTGETTQSITVCPGLTSQEYSVEITDQNECSFTDYVSVCVIDVRCGKKLNKVEICHVDEEYPEQMHTICISRKAVPAHLAHGDMLGDCDADRTCDDQKDAIFSNTITGTETGSALLNSYPNPFGSSNTITFELPQEGHVTLKILDYSGRVVEELYNGYAEESKAYRFNIESNRYVSGIYVCILQQANGKITYHKMICNN